MNNLDSNTEKKKTNIHVIQAAGGLIWRDTPKGREICILYRSRYNDWTLPKGKLKPGEDWYEAALREVHEETGCDVIIEDFAGCTSYLVAENPKVVLYWNMSVISEGEFTPSEEINRLVWVSSSAARIKLTYVGEKALLPDH
ncbi:MAG: NUDIX hydrolase [Anaerolineales bacterium]